jgi:phosphoribosylanthranilate isomerase
VGPFVKICGIASAADAAAVAALGPDAMGFIFWPGSRRCVAPADVAAWARHIPAPILKVGVFVDAAPGEVAAAVAAAGLDVVQLHGREDPGRYALPGVRLWQVVRTGAGEAATGPACIDAYLVDTYSEQSPGGTGRVGDWAAARAFVSAAGRPVILAGGLTPDNVRAAVAAVGPWGVDVSSGVEFAPGKKDIENVKRFIGRCRGE